MQTLPNRLARVGLVLAAVAMLLAPATVAQLQNAQLGTFGTQVKVGDFDYIPLTKRASAAVRVLEADYGMPGDVKDNCLLLLQDNADSGPTRAVAVVAPPPAAQLPPTDVYAKDIRLTPCLDRPIGTAIKDTDVVEQTTPYVQRAVEVRYADVNHDGKFGKGDAVYLTTMTGANRGLAATTGTGAWTLRLTPVGDKAPGTFVFPADLDFIAHKATATGPAPPAGGPAGRTMSLVEREGNGWYIIPASVGFAAQQGIPLNAIRIGIVGVHNAQPAITPAIVQLPDAAPQAGQVYNVTVRYWNNGTGAGAGVLVTKLDGVIADVRLTPVLAPGEGTQAVISLVMPTTGGPVMLQVGDSKVTLDVEGGTARVASLASPSTADLEDRIAQLEALLAERKAPQDAQASVQGAPSLAPLVVLGVLGFALVVLRRRAA